MAKFTTNAEVMKLFIDIEGIRKDNDISCDKEVEKIQNGIVEKLSFLVYNNTKKYRKFSNYDDLVQEGFVGLLRAVRKFDRNLFPNFFVYAEEKWIKHSVKRAASRFDVVYNPNKQRVIYTDDSNIEEEEDKFTPETVFLEKERCMRIIKALNEFPDRDKEIVKRLFGLGNYNGHTLRGCAPVFNITHESVRKIKDKVISKLRKNNSISEIY